MKRPKENATKPKLPVEANWATRRATRDGKRRAHFHSKNYFNVSNLQIFDRQNGRKNVFRASFLFEKGRANFRHKRCQFSTQKMSIFDTNKCQFSTQKNVNFRPENIFKLIFQTQILLGPDFFLVILKFVCFFNFSSFSSWSGPQFGNHNIKSKKSIWVFFLSLTLIWCCLFPSVWSLQQKSKSISKRDPLWRLPVHWQKWFENKWKKNLKIGAKLAVGS